MLALHKKKIKYRLISTGQHPISKSKLFEIFNLKRPDIVLYDGKPFTTYIKMILWAIQILAHSQGYIHSVFRKDRKGIVLVQGDTVSTALGAILAKRAGLRLAHVEAGMWSGNLMNPFPEEIDRRIVSFFADINFCPADLGFNNLTKYKNKIVIHTMQNTQLDAFRLIRGGFQKVTTQEFPRKYFIFILHRTENLSNQILVEKLIKVISDKSKTIPCVFIAHHTSRHTLERYGLLEKIEKNNNIILMPRLGYPEFMKTLHNAQFLVTDGGGNQMEGAYLGIPTLILRKLTESPEGIGKNVVLSKLDFGVIKNFFNNYQSYRTQENIPTISPSEIITKVLVEQIKK